MPERGFLHVRLTPDDDLPFVEHRALERLSSDFSILRPQRKGQPQNCCEYLQLFSKTNMRQAELLKFVETVIQTA